MIFRYPWMIPVDGLAHRWGDAGARLNGKVRVFREMDRDIDWFAPRWIAWLYRWLPRQVGWHGKGYDHDRPAFYLWSIWAPRWCVAWLPKRRADRYGARIGVLMLGVRAVIL